MKNTRSEAYYKGVKYEYPRKDNDNNNSHYNFCLINFFMENLEEVQMNRYLNCDLPCPTLQEKGVENPYICCLNCKESLLCLSKKVQNIQYATPCTLNSLQRCQIIKGMKEFDKAMPLLMVSVIVNG